MYECIFSFTIVQLQLTFSKKDIGLRISLFWPKENRFMEVGAMPPPVCVFVSVTPFAIPASDRSKA